MSTGKECDPSVTAPAAATAADSRFRRWARRRLRQARWLAASLAVVFLVTAVGVMLSRTARLVGLPDVGDPFDLAQFQTLNRIPEAEDAFVLIRSAAGMASQPPLSPGNRMQGLPTGGWSKVDPKLRDWFDSNRAALTLYHQAAMRPDGIMNRGADADISWRYVELGPFALLGMLEGLRLEDQGDMEGAWNSYRMVLRIRTLVMRRGSEFQRFYIEYQCERLQQRIESWCAHRRTDVTLLRRALDDVKACEPSPEWDAYSLKIDYLIKMSELDAPGGELALGSSRDLDYQFAELKLVPEIARVLYAARRFARNDPEVSRRVLRLAFANWLAHLHDSAAERRKPSALAIFPGTRWNAPIPFFTVGPEAPASARRMPPDELASRILTTHDAASLLDQWRWWPVRLSEKRNHASLVMLLAEELYRREQGTPPPNDSALVGRYLDHLPDDGSDEHADEGSRRVRRSTGIELEPD
jgi:hypothetical protein